MNYFPLCKYLFSGGLKGTRKERDRSPANDHLPLRNLFQSGRLGSNTDASSTEMNFSGIFFMSSQTCFLASSEE